MEDRKRSSKRNHHTGGKVATGAVLLALLLAGGHFGLGIGRDGGGLLTGEGVQTVSQNAESAKQKASETVQKASETTQETLEKLQGAIAPQDDGVLTVTVREDKLLYKGKEVTLGQLEEALLKDYKAGSSTVELKDDHAIKASYDEVKALLQKLSIPFTVGK